MLSNGFVGLVNCLVNPLVSCLVKRLVKLSLCDRGFYLGRPALLSLAILTLGACSQQLKIPDIEAQLKSDIERQGRRLSLKEVKCPSEIPRQAGAYFRCVGELKPEGTFTINVIQQDESGSLEWDIPNSKAILNLPRVEANIQDGLTKAVGKRAVIDCGSETYRANQPGDRFECAVVGGLTVGTEQIETVLVKIDSDGNLNWQEMRQPTQPVTVATQGQPAATAAKPGSPTTTAPASNTAAPKRQVERPYVPGDND